MPCSCGCAIPARFHGADLSGSSRCFSSLRSQLFIILTLVVYRRDRWRSLNVAIVAVALTGIAETGLILLLSVLAPHTASL